MFHLGFEPERLSDEHITALERMRVQASTDILTMVTLANSGHPGGSMSTLPALLLLYANCRVDPAAPLDDLRDRIFVSHGHISPATYSTLSAFGFCDREESIVGFRRFGSHFSGHVEISVPGVEWNTGNLGQGLSVGVGAALAGRLVGADPKADLREQSHDAAYRSIVLMGDGEQQKGQISEARRLAVKYGCTNLIAYVDANRLQIGGACDHVMPQDIAAGWASDGWDVIECDGHDWQDLYAAFRQAYRGGERPVVVIARTIMGKGVDFMEDLAKYHGQAVPRDALDGAIAQLGGVNRIDEYEAIRNAMEPGTLGHHFPENPPPRLTVGPARVYEAGTVTDCRSAYGHVMKELAEGNNNERIKVAAFSADLEGSVKLNAFHAESPAGFIEGGIQEHNSATASGRLSKEGFVTFFSTFGIFGVTETFNQQRLNGFNRSNLKLVCTHCGTDVGEDGPTHQVVDYVGLLRSTFDWNIFVPADANQCDRIIRVVADRAGNDFVGMGRSKMAVIEKADGGAFYDGSVGFVPGRAEVLRDGDDGAILAVGPMVGPAVAAHDLIFAATGKRVRIVNMASLRPYDADAIASAAATGYVLTAEDHHPDTGLGGIVGMELADQGIATRLERAGVNQWPMSGKPNDIFAAFGLDAKGLADRVIAALS
ncbi:MAG: transketolase [Deltaproteobacteria bacterium]|nr:transketolase [Deltaproteobacteria bacterium]